MRSFISIVYADPCNRSAMQDTSSFRCRHQQSTEHPPEGLALISIGNSLRGDDGVASVLCDSLSGKTLQMVCRFDLGCFTANIGDCLPGHRYCIIVDSMVASSPIGTVLVIDLLTAVRKPSWPVLQSSHGFSLLDELRIASARIQLPERVVFFGIEVGTNDWSSALTASMKERLARLVDELTAVVLNIMEPEGINA